jgi:hypothetical protein
MLGQMASGKRRLPMSGAQGFRADEARFTPITVAGIAAIICLSGVLVGSVLQGGGGSQSAATRAASGSAVSQAGPTGTAFTPAQAAALSIPSGPPVNTTAVPAAGVGVAATGVATTGVVGTGATAPIQASRSTATTGSTAATTSVAGAARSTIGTSQVLPAGGSESSSAQSPFTQSTTTEARVASSAIVPGVSGPAPSTASSSSFAGSAIGIQPDDSQPGGNGSTTVNGLSVPPGQDIQQVTGGAPGWGDFQDVWTPAMTGTGQWIIGPGGTAPPGADPSKTIYLKPGQGAVQVNGTYVVYDGTGGVPGTLAYAP